MSSARASSNGFTLTRFPSPELSWRFSAHASGWKHLGAVILSEGRRRRPKSKNLRLLFRGFRRNQSGQQLTEMDWSGSTLQSWHTNVWAAGQLIATYSDPDLSQSQTAVLDFQFGDWLGTRRILTDYTGNVQETCHSLPYGNGEDCMPTPTEHVFTQHERDSETGGTNGNDYFFARYYASSMGRFLSPDPTRLSQFFGDPQTWNMYSYAHNNPVSYVDRNGKWPAYRHDQIIDQAFQGILTPAQLQILKDVSAHQDAILSGGQSNSLAFQHAMRGPGESVAQAQADYNTFVSLNENQATKDQINFWLAGNSGYSDRALAEFAAALHAILDSTSPAHEGFQVWDWQNPTLVANHIRTESTITPWQLSVAVAMARNAFNETFNPSGFIMGWDEFDLLNLLTKPPSNPSCTIYVTPNGNYGGCNW